MKGIKNTTKRASRRQREVLVLIAEGAEDWAQVWIHYETLHDTTHRHHFDRTTDTLVRNGMVDDTGDILSITDAGLLAVDRYNEDGGLSRYGRALRLSGRWGQVGEGSVAPDLAPWNEA